MSCQKETSNKMIDIIPFHRTLTPADLFSLSLPPSLICISVGILPGYGRTLGRFPLGQWLMFGQRGQFAAEEKQTKAGRQSGRQV